MRYFLLLLILVLSVFILLSCGTESTPVYTLSTSVIGEGSVSPEGGTYEEGEVVTLTSTPSQHWVFNNWSGDGSGSSSTITITMDRDKNVVGNFQRRDYPLTITVEGEGTVEERIVSSPKTTDYPSETVIELSPSSESGWRFVEWGGDLSGDVKPIQITISEEKNVSVTFEPIVYLDENGVTIMCPDGQVGDIGIVDGVEYEVVDRELLLQRIEEGKGSLNRRVCVSLVTNMRELFREIGFNQSINDWDVSNVYDMRRLFDGSSFNKPIENWNVSHVRNMDGMFKNSPFNQPIGDWDVSNVTNMAGMFGSTPFNQPIGDWDVSNVKYMDGMFSNSEFNQPIGNWDVGNVTSIGGMFLNSQFNQPIGSWDVSKVLGMYWMFNGSQFNQPIGDWDVSNVTNMAGMFGSTPFNQNISNWCVTRIETEPELFSSGAPLTQQNKPKWGTCPD